MNGYDFFKVYKKMIKYDESTNKYSFLDYRRFSKAMGAGRESFISKEDALKEMEEGRAQLVEYFPFEKPKTTTQTVTIEPKQTYTMTCYKCEGEGFLKVYEHIDNGICYTCGGKGKIEKSK